MKRLYYYLNGFLALAILLTFSLEAFGRGGGRGGGRIGGGRPVSGGHRVRGRSMNRSPSMSRSARPPRRAGTSRIRQPRPGTRRPRPPSQRFPANSPSRNQIRNFMQDRPSTRPSRPTLPGGRFDGLPGRPGVDRPQRPGIDRPERQEIAGNIRGKIHDRFPNRSEWFDNDFWDNRNRRRPPYYRRDHNWWKWATAAGVTSWFRWGREPVYYGYYGDGIYDGYYGYDAYWGPVDYPDSPGTTADYSEQIQQIETAEDQPATGDEWMPLGVFAVTKEKGTTVTPNFYIQLAVNKEGLISGTLYNTTTDRAYELEGLVDEASQLAAWKMSDSKNSPIIDTGIYNLTRDETPARVTFADGQRQNIVLVRVQEQE